MFFKVLDLKKIKSFSAAAIQHYNMYKDNNHGTSKTKLEIGRVGGNTEVAEKSSSSFKNTLREHVKVATKHINVKLKSKHRKTKP